MTDPKLEQLQELELSAEQQLQIKGGGTNVMTITEDIIF